MKLAELLAKRSTAYDALKALGEKLKAYQPKKDAKTDGPSSMDVVQNSVFKTPKMFAA